ncbi:multi-sensor hybrid histidine kinase : Chemotaxis protein CheY OS=Burkholderia glathei GN=BG61_10730 PE=4 SV=1: Response_reg [Gemmata massiliana]|uniref:Response regulatory domain-containing protein n=1 Tax=Gemmata massiliana TaxID=1210884 RepID=A0A6P2CYW5_9BACT|nr:response regulator [Gemmata massiliana]VTR92984.1 multi-sensor hybrid histidine kinase : Chemotaxis protein CheY OS=Burkholderia glathei GN=BG61_10730 PE=4 SV=1: Response_reg [Gemmata massiliana]
MDTLRPAALRVLVVDDNRDAADTLAMLLELRRYEVRAAYNGTHGLRVAREWVPDCVISDIQMPELDGYALARAVRADPTLAETKLVALSAFSDAGHARRAADAGFDHQITKASDTQELLEVLTVIEEIKKLATQTQELAQQNVELAGQTKQLLREVKEEVKEVKQDVRELKHEVKELKDERNSKKS